MNQSVSGVMFLLLLSIAAYAGTDDSAAAREFFDLYIRLSDGFDVGIAELYADDARIQTYRRYPHGLERAAEMTGREYKALIRDFMPIAEKKNDTSEFRDIRIMYDGGKARISAERYSTMKCYEDTAYYMVIETRAEGKYLIVEEYSETQPQSDCGLSVDIQAVVRQYEDQLPTMVDADTRLDRVQFIEPETIRFQYTLVNYSREELDLDDIREAMVSVHRDQTCNWPTLKQLLEKGAVVSYLYEGKNGASLFTVDVTEGQCQ